MAIFLEMRWEVTNAGKDLQSIHKACKCVEVPPNIARLLVSRYLEAGSVDQPPRSGRPASCHLK